MKKSNILCIAILSFSLQAPAAVVVTTFSDTSATFTNRNPISAASLILNGSSTLASATFAGGGGIDNSRLNDGLDTAAGASYYSTLWAKYELNVSGSNAQGYNLTEIRVYSTGADARVFQDYTITYRLVGEADGTFSHTLASNVMLDSTVRGTTLSTSINPYQQTSITESGGGNLATGGGVKAIMFNYSPHVRTTGTGGNYNLFMANGGDAGYTSNFLEFTVLGSAVPESGSIVLAILGALCFAIFHRRRPALN